MKAHASLSAAFAIAACALSPAAAQTAQQPSEADKAAIDAAVRKQVGKCWSPPPLETGAPVPRVLVGFELTPEGALSGPPRVISSGSQALTAPSMVAAVAAVQKCAPYSLPARFHDHWRQVRITFDATPLPASPSPQ